MDDQALRELLRRVQELERTTVRYRQGEVADTGPLDVTLGGASTIIENAPRLVAAGELAASDPVAALTFGNGLLILGRIGDPPAFLTDQDTTTRDGSPSGNVIYQEATVTLTPGSWLVEAHATLLNLATADSCCVGIYDRTGGAEISNSRGAAAVATTTLHCGVHSGLVKIDTATTIDVCPYAVRNGASTLRVASVAGAPAGKITAVQL